MKDSLTQALSETCLEASQSKINAPVDRAGNTSLHLAALRGEAALIEGLLQQAPELAMSVNQQGQSVLHLAAQQQQPEALQRLLSLMQAEQITLCLTRHDAHGKQPLFYALYHNHPLMTKALLEQGANVNDIVDENHQSTALHVAAFWGHIDILQLLLEHGASIAALNETRHTPIEVGLIQHPRWALACLRLHYQLDSTLLGLHLSQDWLKIWQEAEAACANGNLAEASAGFDMLRQYAEQQALLPLQIYCIGTEASLRLEQAASLAALAHEYNEFTSFLAKKAWRKAALMYEEAAKFYNAALGYTIYHAKELDEFNDNPLPATYADSLWASLQAVSSCMAQELFKCLLPTLSPILGYRQASAAIPKVMAFELEESSSLRDCLDFATGQVKALLTRMLREAEQVLGKPPCGYAAIGLGSMSRNEISPCSDIEWALLLEKDTPAHRHYFRQLTQWVHLSLIHLGQTPLPLQRYSTPQLMLTIRCNDALSPTPQGLRLDEALISPLGHSEVECELMGEPQNLAQWVMERLLQCEELPARLPMFHTLQSSVFIHGQPHLAKIYSQAIRHYIQQRLKSGRQQEEALGLLKVHTEEDYPLALQQVANHGNLSVKAGLYRPVTMIVNDLVMYYGLFEQNTWDRIAALQRLGHISQAAAKHLTQALEGSMRFRLTTHLHYGTEYEALWHPTIDVTEVATAPLTVYKPPLVLSDSQIDMLGTIYKILLPFYQDIACFINTQGKTKALRIANWESLNKVEEILAKALSASYANRLNEAIVQLKEAITLKADNPTIYLQLLLCLQQGYPSDNSLEVKETLTKLIHLLCHQQADAHRHLTYYSALPDSLRHYYRMNIAAKAASQNAMSRRLTKLLWDLNCHPDRGGGRERVKELQQNWRQALQGIIGNTDSGVYLWTATGKKQPLCQAAIEQLLVNGQFKENRINGGQHNVVELRCGDSHLFVKENPELAGMSFLIERLHEEFIGHGTTRSELAMLQVQERFMPVLLSLPVAGPSLQQVLLDTPQLLAKLNHRAFSERVFMALMTNPEDGLPTNEIVEALPSGDHVLTSIDHDHAMFPAFALETDEQTQASKLQLKVKTILYCLPQMHATVDPLARDAFVKLDIRQRLRAVLQAAQLQNSAYEVLNRQASTQINLRLFSRPSVKKNIPVPIKPGDASLLFHKALRLQRFLRMYPEATLLQCLLHIEPRVGILYAQAFIDEPQPIDRLRKLGNYSVNPQGIMVSRTQAIETIRLASNQITPKLYAPEELRPQEGMVELDTLAAQQADSATIRAEVQQGEFSRFKAIRVPEHRDSIINGDSECQLAGIDWSPLNNKQQLSLLQALVEPVTGYPHGVPLYRLNLAGCRVLAIQHFEQLLRTCPDLSWLDISGHAGMTESQVRLLAKACKTLQVLVIKNLPRLRQLTKCAFPQLRQLVIDGCPVTEVTLDAPHLQIFSAKNCTALTHLALPMSSQLKTVKLRGCEQITMQALKERYPCFISQPGLTQQWLVKVSKTLEKAFPANIPLAMQQEVVYQAMVSYQQYLQPIYQLAASQLEDGTAELLVHFGFADNRVIEFLLEDLRFGGIEDHIAAIDALGQLGQAKPFIIEALMQALGDDNYAVREAASKLLGQLGQAEPLVIEALVRALGDKDFPAREAAAKLLGQLGQADSCVLEALVQALVDGNYTVRRAAVGALGQLGQAKPFIIEALMQALGDDNYAVREAASKLLGQLGQAEPLVIEALVRALGDKDFPAREAAAELLGQLGQAESCVLEVLVQALGNGDYTVRRAAAGALGQLGQAKPFIIGALMQALGDDNYAVREAASKLLGQLGQAERWVIKALVRALGDKVSAARQSAAELLGQLGQAESYVLEVLVQALVDGNVSVRRAAAQALGQLGQAEFCVIKALVQALGDGDYTVHWAAAGALGQLGQAESCVIEALVRALGDKDFPAREAAAELLGQLGQAESYVLEVLVQALVDGNDSVRRAAAQALGQLGQAESYVLEVLVQALVDGNDSVRRAAAQALGQLGQAEPLVIEALVQALGDKDFPARESAAELLGQLGQAESCVIEVLVQALGDGDYTVRRAAAKALGQLGQAESRVIEALVQALGDKNFRVREAAAKLLGQLGQAESYVLEVLVQALGDGNYTVRWAAAGALGQLGQAKHDVLEVLVQALGDGDYTVRRAAAKALGQLGQAKHDVIEALVRALGDENFRARKAVAKALGQLGLLGQAKPSVIIALMQLSLDNNLIFDVAAEILGQLIQANHFITKALLHELYKYKKVCQAAAVALGQLSQAEPFLMKALVQQLLGNDFVVRHAAARVISQLGQAEPFVINALVQVLDDEYWHVGQTAAKVLGQLGQAEPFVINALVRTLGSRHSIVCHAAAEALVKLSKDNPSVINALVRVLDDECWQVGQPAAEVLGQLGQVKPFVINALVRALVSYYDNLRHAAAEALVKLSKANPFVITALLQVSGDKDCPVNHAVTKTLGQFRQRDPRLLEALLYENDIKLRKTAVRVLGHLSKANPFVIKELVQTLDNKLYYVREAAAEALGQLNQAEPLVIKALLQALDDVDYRVRQAAARALARLSQERYVLLQVLDEADLRLINLLIRALGEHQGKIRLALNKLLRTLLQPDVAFNLLIAQSLPQLTPMHSFHTVTTKEKTENSAVASIAALQPSTASVDNNGLIRQSKNESIASLYFKEMESELTTLHSLALPESLGGTHEIIRFLQHNLRNDAVINPFEWDMHPDTGELSLENQTFPYAIFNSEFLQSAEKKAFVLPLLLMRAHFAGLVIYKTQDKFKVIYINPTGTNPPQKGEDKEALAKIGQALQKLKDKHQLVFEEIKILSNNQQLNESDCAFIVAQSLAEMANGQALSIKKYDGDLTCYVKPIAHARANFYSRACLGDNYEATIRDQWYARLAKAFTMNIAYVNELTHFIENEGVNPHQLDERILVQLKVLVRQINDNTIAKQQGTLLVDKATSFLTTSYILKTIDIKEIKLFCEQLLEPHFTEEGSLIFKLHPQLQKCSQKSGKDFNGTSSTQQTHPAYGSLFASEPGNIRQISELHAKAEEQNQSEEAAKPSI